MEMCISAAKLDGKNKDGAVVTVNDKPQASLDVSWRTILYSHSRYAITHAS